MILRNKKKHFYYSFYEDKKNFNLPTIFFIPLNKGARALQDAQNHDLREKRWVATEADDLIVDNLRNKRELNPRLFFYFENIEDL